MDVFAILFYSYTLQALQAGNKNLRIRRKQKQLKGGGAGRREWAWLFHPRAGKPLEPQFRQCFYLCLGLDPTGNDRHAVGFCEAA